MLKSNFIFAALLHNIIRRVHSPIYTLLIKISVMTAMNLIQPNKEQLDHIYDEFGTSAERIREDVRTLVEWLSRQTHLPNITDEKFLEHFLLRCKNSLELAKVVLERYLSLKTILPEVYDNRDPFDASVSETMEVISFIPVPNLTPDGCRVSVFQIQQPDKYETLDPVHVIKSMIMTGDLRLQIDGCHSDIFIFDLGNFSLPVITKVLANIRKFMLPATKGIPMRQKQYYVINAKPSTESVIMMAKSILPKNLTKKLKVLKNMEELLDFIPKQCLPKDYGGEQPPFSELNKAWIVTVQSHADWFKEHDNIKADTSKKLNRGDSKIGDVPLEGSFRLMSFD